MKNIIVVVNAIFCLTKSFASLNVNYSLRNEFVYVKVSGPDGINEFSFPCSRSAYTQTLLPYIANSETDAEIAYKLELEYVHNLVATQSSKNDDRSKSLLHSIIGLVCSLVMMAIYLKSFKNKRVS